jgi:hypothetical protein
MEGAAREIGASEAKNSLGTLLDQVEQGEAGAKKVDIFPPAAIMSILGSGPERLAELTDAAHNVDE